MDEESSDSEHEMDNSTNESNETDSSSCYVTPDGRKFWTPNCDVTEKPFLNQHFPTLEDAFIFYREYGRICGFDVRKSTQKSDGHGNVKAKHIQCNRAGWPKPKKAKYDEIAVQSPKKRRRTSSRRCGCKAQIVMKSSGFGGFVVMSFVEEHNHPLASEAGKMFLRCNRDLSVGYQNFIMDCAKVNIGPTRAHSLAKEMVGSYENVGATATDFKNFSRDVKVRIGEHDADMILAKFKLKKESSNNTFYYDYKVDKEGHLTGLFWTDATGRANYDVFGDVISFDPTFRTNRYNMVFVPFTGVNNHWRNVTFAAGLIAKENYKNFKWLLKTFNFSMGRVPPCVITDQCLAIKKALAKHWPSSKHRLCMWHIMNKLPGKIGPVLSSNKKFMDKMKSIVWADHLTQDEFEEDVEMAGLLRTTSRQRLQSADDDKKSERTPLAATTMKIEVDALKQYTQELYYLVRDEITSACYHTSMVDMTKDNEARHFKCKDAMLHGKFFEVSVRLHDYDVKCSCKLYFRRGYLCIHAFAALQHCSVDIIPPQYVKLRWTKFASNRHSILGSTQVSDQCAKRARIKVKKTTAWFEFQTCMKNAGEDEFKVDAVITGLKTINSGIKDSSSTSTVLGGAQRVDKFIGPLPQSNISIQNPNISRNKGCRSRIKSSREISIEVGKGRKCGRCNQIAGHNARSCTFNK
ncbi:hypothetical protein POM88_054180 [Heracleum sosnowskyi]|uniref:SWIM-type domain-containing protein n=1 Tax=Heracleum sosnowskyi TaxID=360622 RepID=A0AAD8GN81_9APIA|nr:hypothetical protein POM88_054180 [Heracleum sosnowskyi]